MCCASPFRGLENSRRLLLSSSSLLLSVHKGCISFLCLRRGKKACTWLLLTNLRIGGSLQASLGTLCVIRAGMFVALLSYSYMQEVEVTHAGSSREEVKWVVCLSRTVSPRAFGIFVQKTYCFGLTTAGHLWFPPN